METSRSQMRKKILEIVLYSEKNGLSFNEI